MSGAVTFSQWLDSVCKGRRRRLITFHYLSLWKWRARSSWGYPSAKAKAGVLPFLWLLYLTSFPPPQFGLILSSLSFFSLLILFHSKHLNESVSPLRYCKSLNQPKTNEWTQRWHKSLSYLLVLTHSSLLRCFQTTILKGQRFPCWKSANPYNPSTLDSLSSVHGLRFVLVAVVAFRHKGGP